jgi:hypothetical protein
MAKNDVFVHADLDGAIVCIVKNPYSLDGSTSSASTNAPPPPAGITADTPIPPLTLHQAGTLSVVHSKAWDSKIVTSPWWVKAEQVSKIAGGAGGKGGLLGVGLFDVRGKKCFLPPVQLIYGFGLLFQVEEASAARHLEERRPWLRGGSAQDTESATSSYDLGNMGSVQESLVVEDFEDEGTEEILDTNGGQEDVVEIVEAAEQLQSDSKLADEQQDPSDANEGTQCDDNADPITESMDSMSLISTMDSKKDGGKTRFSAKQRRELKKKGVTALAPETLESLQKTTKDDGEEVQNVNDDDGDSEDDETSSVAPSITPSMASNSSKTNPTVKPAPRGKRGKLKKMKDKYADQDDEDRELMLEVLGSAKGAARKAAQDAKEAAEREKAAALKAKKKAAADAAMARVKAKMEQEVSGDVESKRKAPTEVPVTEKTSADAEEAGDADDQRMDLSMLDLLTGQPTSEDNLVAAIPVCAPWNCLSKYKYKVKLIPG